MEVKHTYSINAQNTGHDPTSWEDAFADACAACEAVFDDEAGMFFVLADDDKPEAVEAVRALAKREPLDLVCDEFQIVHDGHGTNSLARKYVNYKSDPREPEDWFEYTVDELKELRENSSLSEHEEIDRAIADAEAGMTIYVAHDEDGHYFAFKEV
jgi:hypothetical protein